MGLKKLHFSVPMSVIAMLLAVESAHASDTTGSNEPSARSNLTVVHQEDGGAMIVDQDGSSVSFSTQQIEALKKLHAQKNMSFQGNIHCARMQ